jgi:hypothetical protein
MKLLIVAMITRINVIHSLSVQISIEWKLGCFLEIVLWCTALHWEQLNCTKNKHFHDVFLLFVDPFDVGYENSSFTRSSQNGEAHPISVLGLFGAPKEIFWCCSLSNKNRFTIICSKLCEYEGKIK